MHPLVKNTIKFFYFGRIGLFILVGLPGSELG